MSQQRRRSFSKTMLLCLLLSVFGSLLPSFAGANEFVPDHRAFAIAEHLLEVRGHSLADCSLVRDNLAYYLIQGAKLSRLEGKLEVSPELADDEVVRCVSTKRWKSKVGRTLATPGDNRAILARLQTISVAFAAFSRQVHDAAADQPYELILSGSLVKGHFSPGSDIDLIVDTTDPTLAEWAMESQWSTTTEQPADYDEQVAIADAGDYSTKTAALKLRLLGQTVAIAGRVYDEQFLFTLYLEAMAARGIDIEATTGSVAYRENNSLFRLEREMPLWMVATIEKAKNLREALAALFSSKASATADQAPYGEPSSVLQLLQRERAARVHSR